MYQGDNKSNNIHAMKYGEPWKHYVKWSCQTQKFTCDSTYMKCSEQGKLTETEKQISDCQGVKWNWERLAVAGTGFLFEVMKTFIN